MLYEIGSQTISDGAVDYILTVEAANHGPIRRAWWFYTARQDQADEFIRGPTVMLGPEAESRTVKDLTDRTFAVYAWNSSHESPLRLWQNRFNYMQWVIIGVEFADGSRWAKVEELPDPRTSRSLTCRIEEGRCLRPARR
jgi:hypothetical protein